MKTLKIHNPIYIEHEYAYISISKWNFDELADKEGNLIVEVYDGNELKGWNVVNKSKWIRTKKLKEEKVVFRPDDPMVYFYNNLPLLKPKTKEEKDEEILKASLK